MPSKYGINVELHNSAPTSYDINNTYPIAIVGDDDTLTNGLYHYGSVEEALQAVGVGSIKNTLQDLEATNLQSQIILSVFSKTIGESEDITQENINKAIDSITALKNAEQELSIKPKFILCPQYNDLGVYEKLKSIATSLRAYYAIELNATDGVSIKKALESIQTHRAIITFQKVQRIDKVVRPASAFIIALYAKIMASSDFGFAQTYSNRIIDGIIGVVDTIEYIQGEDCEADRLRALGVTTIFVDNGIRAWGRHTRDAALGIESLHSIVIFDTIIETLFASQKEAIDKQVADMVKQLQDDLNSFYRKLIANNVIVGYEISLPEDLNTNEAIAQGEIYIKQEVQEMPLISKVVNKIYRVTKYSQELIKEL
ncbi:phage tail protein [Helicobacter sp. MIT 05-5293]|uniref:major tail sheath protein n=1 Tax=Helicobacter sp. MIT 05-5293 TaxID=1548149 RepID=UPI00051CE75A|nr:major tail sheath protein [Helicobacter sp. MIT 05-5293]TLD80184.1 phage tail protein [Helicobacter sp. MIT 05-5293]